MSAACRTGYVNSPTLDRSAPCLADLSLNWVIRLVTLHEQGAPLRVDPQRQQLRRRHPGTPPQLLRLVSRGDRVQVDHAVERVMRRLQRHPMSQRPEIVPQMVRISRGLDAGQYAGTAVSHATHSDRHPRTRTHAASRFPTRGARSPDGLEVVLVTLCPLGPAHLDRQRVQTSREKLSRLGA